MSMMTELPPASSFKRAFMRTNSFPVESTQSEDIEVSVFTKPKIERTDEDISYAIQMLKGVPFFSSLKKEDIENAEMDQLLTQVFDSIKCQAFKQGEIIFQHREKGSKFYLIIEGNVDIYVPRTEEEINQDIERVKTLPLRQLRFSVQRCSADVNMLPRELQNSKKSVFITPTQEDEFSDAKSAALRFQKASSLLQNLKSNNNGLKFDTINSLLNIKDCFHIHENHLVCKYKKIRTLGPGEQFGELALLSDSDRSATVVAASNLQVATLCKKSFTQISRNFKKIFRSKVDFFAELMGREPESSVARICYGFKERHYIYGQKIFVQGQIPTEVFIVKNGEVQLSMQETQEKTSSLALPFISKNRKPSMSMEKIAALGPFSFLGQNEALDERPYEMTATSYSNKTVVYTIPIKEFKNLKNTFPDVFQKFAKKNLVQMSYFENRPDKVSAPKKSSGPNSPLLESESRSPRLSAMKDLTQIHSPKFFEKRLERLFSPKVKDTSSCPSQRSSVRSRDSSCSTPKTTMTDFNLGIMSPPKSMFKSPSQNKRDFSITKDAYGFGEYDLGINSYRQPTEPDSVKTTKDKSCNVSQEFTIERTLKILKEKVKLRRSLSKDFGQNSSRSSFFSKRSTSNQHKN